MATLDKEALVCCEEQGFLQERHLFFIRSASSLQFFASSWTVGDTLTCFVGNCARVQGSLQFVQEQYCQTSPTQDMYFDLRNKKLKNTKYLFSCHKIGYMSVLS